MCIMRIFLAVIAVTVAATTGDDISVETKVGTFIGFTDEVDIAGSAFYLSKFLGIPYAEPPIGDLRFRKSIPKSPLTKPFQAKQHGNACMQVLAAPNPLKGSEDCLFLNIFSPATSTDNTEKVPVMIWIHGGGFLLSSSKSVLPDRLVANGPVIVVTLNYRLAVLGFLTTGDSNSPGNYGLWDHHLAIQWVHDNIDKFGGDPNSVTIFGESAGSAIVIYQGLFPGNKGLFQRIIGQSGSPLALWSRANAPELGTKEFATLVGCENEDNKVMIDCLRVLNNDVINSTMNDFANGLAFKSVFIPNVDGEFLTEYPDDVFGGKNERSESAKVFASFDLLSGANSGEGYCFTPPLGNPVEQENFLPNSSFFKESLVPQFATMFLKETSPLLFDAIAAEYTDWTDPENQEKVRDMYIDMMGDFLFVAPMYSTVDFHTRRASGPSSYMYYFTSKPPYHVLDTPSWATKPNHGDDLIYVFGGEGDGTEFARTFPPMEDWQIDLANNMMTMWTNFAKTGNPNKPRDLGIDWIPYTGSHQHYLDISRTLTSRNVKTRLEGRRMNFWSKIVPSIRDTVKSKASDEEGSCDKDGGCPP